MARYAEWNKFVENLKTDKYGDTDVIEVGIAFQKATADVVPKSEVEELGKEIERLTKILNSYALQYGTVKDQQSVIDKAKAEVAREIFEEIDKLAKEGGVIWTHYAAAVLAELKKKYTEGR